MMKNKTYDPKRRPKSTKGSRIGIQNSLEMRDVQPMTGNQRRAFESWESGQNLFLSGFAGTGKTFVASYLAISSGLKVYVVRSAVPTRDMGFMPGNAKEKAALYEGPYVDAFTKIFGRGDAWTLLTQKGNVEFVTTSYLRGLTLDNCVVIADECANYTFHELDTLITRVGVNCRIIFLGDVTQSDFVKDSDKAGLKRFMKIIQEIGGFDFIEYGISDIVRSDMVRDYIIAKDRLTE